MDGHTLVGLFDEHASDEAFGLLTYGFPAREVELERLLQSHLDCLDRLLVVEGKRAA